MAKFTLLPGLLLVLFCSCNTAKQLSPIGIPQDQTTENKPIKPGENRFKEYQPSGSLENNFNGIQTENCLAESNFNRFNSEFTLQNQLDNNYGVNKTTILSDTIPIQPVNLIELNEANQSQTLGLTSLIALIASLLFTVPGIFIFSIAFFLGSLVLCILGLRKGIIARRIITQKKDIYSNAKKAKWGIILSLSVLVIIVTVLVLFLGYIIPYNSF